MFEDLNNTRARLRAHRGTFGILGALFVTWLLIGHEVTTKTADRYTGTQAAQDWEIQHGVDARQNSEIDALRNWTGLR